MLRGHYMLLCGPGVVAGMEPDLEHLSSVPSLQPYLPCMLAAARAAHPPGTPHPSPTETLLIRLVTQPLPYHQLVSPSSGKPCLPAT